MRVVAGQLGGRTFDSPHTHRTHPMSDRIRGALFGTLGDIVGLEVLDAFAGSGASGFEAASRGASRVLCIENDVPAQRAIERNILQLGLAGTVKLVKANCSGWSTNNPTMRFDLVLADPPFDDLQVATVTRIADHTSRDGLFVLNWPGSSPLPTLSEDFDLTVHKTFGDAQLAFYRRTS